MQQHCQLASRRNDGPFLSCFATTLGQFQTPSSQIAISSKRTQYVVRSLHQQGAQIRIPLFADMHLRLTLPRVSASRLQSGVATYIAALYLLVVLGDALTQRPSTVACMIPVPFSS